MKNTISFSSSVASNNILKIAFLIVLFTFINTSTHAQTKTWDGSFSSDWSHPLNWSGNFPPSGLENIIIPNVSTNDPEISSLATAKSITVENGGNLTILNSGFLNIASSASHGIQNDGTITNFGQIDILNAGGRGISNEGNFTNDGGTIKIDNTKNGIINTGTGSAFTNDNGTVKIENATQDGIINENAGLFDNLNSGIIEIGQNGGIIEIGQNGGSTRHSISNTDTGSTFTNDNGTIKINNATQDGIKNQSSGLFDNLNNGIIEIGLNGGTIGVNGIYNNSNGAAFTNDNGTIKIDNTNQEGIRNAETGQFDNLNGGIIEFGLNGGTIGASGITNTATSAFTNDNGTIKIDNTSRDGIANVNTGLFDNLNGGVIEIGQNGGTKHNGIHNDGNGSEFTNDNGTIKIDNTSTNGIENLDTALFDNLNSGIIDIGQNGGAGNINEAGIFNQAEFNNNSGGIISIADVVTAGIENFTDGNFSNQSTATITSTHSIQNHGDTFTNNGSLTTSTSIFNWGSATLRGDGDYSLSTTWSNKSIFLAGSSTVSIVGASTAEITGTSATTFYNLEINKSSTDVQLNQFIQVDNEVQMASGQLDLKGYDLTLGTANGTIIGESAASYIYSITGGEIIKTASLNSPVEEDPGNIGVEFTSLAIMGTTIIKRGHTAQSVNGNSSILRYFDISPGNNTGLDAVVRFKYLDIELNGNVEGDLAPFRYNGSTWDEYLITDFDSYDKYVETSGVESFSVWTLAAKSILPVELVYFRAAATDDDQVELEWQTVSELNNDYFTVERSSDGLHFEFLDEISGAGSTLQLANYSTFDEKPLDGLNYYRLQQTDFDGTFEYAEIRVVNFEKQGVYISIYPNPTTDFINIDFGKSIEESTLLLYDPVGRLCMKQVVLRGSDKEQLHASHLPKGTYFLRLESVGLSLNQKIVLQ